MVLQTRPLAKLSYMFILLAVSVVAGNVHAEEAKIKWKTQLNAYSDSTSKGISETQGNGQLDARITAKKGMFIGGLRVKNVKARDGRDFQSALSAGIDTHFHEVRVRSQLIYKVNYGTRIGTDNEFYELATDISKEFGNTEVELSYIYSPDAAGPTKRDEFLEATLTQSLNDKWSVSGGVGMRRTSPARNYNSFNLGAEYKVNKHLSIDMRGYTTDETQLSKAHRGRLVLAIKTKF
jgi:uncharacterized protein (TIGR02001 family)